MTGVHCPLPGHGSFFRGLASETGLPLPLPNESWCMHDGQWLSVTAPLPEATALDTAEDREALARAQPYTHDSHTAVVHDVRGGKYPGR